MFPPIFNGSTADVRSVYAILISELPLVPLIAISAISVVPLRVGLPSYTKWRHDFRLCKITVKSGPDLSLIPLCWPATWPTGWRHSSVSPSALRPSFQATASTMLCWVSTATAATDHWVWAAARTWWTNHWPTAHWENWWLNSRAPTRDTSTPWRR